MSEREISFSQGNLQRYFTDQVSPVAYACNYRTGEACLGGLSLDLNQSEREWELHQTTTKKKRERERKKAKGCVLEHVS